MESTRPLDEGPLDQLDEQLVAYLDGELEDEQRLALEERLMEDPDCKSRLRGLQQSFDLLDELPQASVNKDFARTTVEMVALSASQQLEIVEKQRPWRIGTFTSCVVAACIIAFCTGALFIRHRQLEQQNTELQRLAVAENLRAYSLIKSDDDLSFYESLVTDSKWQEHVSISRNLDELPIRKIDNRLASLPLDERLGQIDEMEPDLRRELRMQNEQFTAQSIRRQTQLLSVYQQIELRDDAEKLLDTLLAYVDWTDRLPASSRSKIQSTPTSERMAKLHEVIDQDAMNLQRWRNIKQLSAEDLDSVYAAMLSIAKTREQEFRRMFAGKEIPDHVKRGLSTNRSIPQEALFAHFLVKELAFRLRKDPSMRPSIVERLSPITAAERQKVRDAIGGKASAYLNQIADPVERENTINGWFIYTAMKRSPLHMFGNDPRQAYETADEAKRERLDLSDPSSALRELRFGRGGRGTRNGRGGSPGFDREREGDGRGGARGGGGPDRRHEMRPPGGGRDHRPEPRRPPE